LPQARERTHRHGEANRGYPPGEAKRTDQRERHQRCENGFDDDDRHLGRNQHRGPWAFLRGRPAQCGDADRKPELAVHEVPEVADARRGIETTPGDGAAGAADAETPRLAANREPDDLKDSGDDEDPDGGRVEGGRELVAIARQGQNERDRQDKSPGGRYRCSMATPRRVQIRRGSAQRASLVRFVGR
jgi:hypothetical protein